MTGAPMPSSGGRTPGLRPRRLVEEPAETGEPARRGPGFKKRVGDLLSSLWTAVRPTRNRATGYVAIGAVGALIGTSAVVGVGAAGALPDLADIGAWLGSSEQGSAAHANGLTGDVDGKVDLPTGKNPISISQDGKTVLVLDKKTGKVIRIDPSQLTAEQATQYSSSDLQLVAGGSYAYVVNPVKGTVQRIDPMTTGPIGSPVNLGVRPLGEAVVDPKGTLWVPQPTNGKVVPFPGGKKGKPLTVTKGKNHNLVMTLANGEPIVTDTTDAITTMLGVEATGLKIKLPSFIQDASPEDVLIPSSTDGSVVPILAAESGKMALLDTRTANLTNAAIGGGGKSEYGPPQVLGSRVYIPDYSNGTLKVYNTAESALEPPLKVTDEPGELEVFVRNGLLWVNDQDNEAAGVINADGKLSRIGKYKTDVPSAKKPDEAPPVVDNVPNVPAQPAPNPGTPTPGPPPSRGNGNGNGNDNSNGNGSGGDEGEPAPRPEPEPSKSETPKPKPSKPLDACKVDPSKCGVVPPPMPPGTPQAQAGPNGVTVTFQPAAGVKPKSYTLQTTTGGAPVNAQVSPGSIGPDGPFQFQVTGLSCANEYSFRVVASFKGGEQKASQPSPAVRPCTAPAAPRNVRIASYNTGGHGFTVAWQPPSNASGTITYTVSWPGGSKKTTGTSAQVSGLSNGRTYNVTVTSANAAGGGSSASVVADLNPRPQTMRIVHNDNDTETVGIRSVPSSTAGKRNGSIPGMSSPSVTVHCKTTGSTETHPYDKVTSNVWAHLTYKGITGYVADIYVDSRKNPNVWDCT